MCCTSLAVLCLDLPEELIRTSCLAAPTDCSRATRNARARARSCIAAVRLNEHIQHEDASCCLAAFALCGGQILVRGCSKSIKRQASIV